MCTTEMRYVGDIITGNISMGCDVYIQKTTTTTKNTTELPCCNIYSITLSVEINYLQRKFYFPLFKTTKLSNIQISINRSHECSLIVWTCSHAHVDGMKKEILFEKNNLKMVQQEETDNIRLCNQVFT